MDVETSLLENLVATELIRRYGVDERVFFYNKNKEVDFYLPDESTAIQVSYNPHQNDDTWVRETEPLLKISQLLDCKNLLLLTYDTEERATIKGQDIEIIPVWKWLLR